MLDAVGAIALPDDDEVTVNESKNRSPMAIPPGSRHLYR